MITAFVAASLLAGYLACGAFVVVMDARYDWVAGTFQLSILYNWISRAIVTTIIFCALGLWTFVAGMWKKSVPVTIVSSVVFIYRRQLVVASMGTYEENIWIILIVTGIALAGIWYIFEQKIMQLD